jgi:hypothetical protein
MIAIATMDGKLLRAIPEGGDATYGFHQLFGFISEKGCEERLENRKRHGLRTGRSGWLCQFKLQNTREKEFNVAGVADCSVKRAKDGAWEIISEQGHFRVIRQADLDEGRLALPIETKEFSLNKSLGITAILGLVLLLLLSIPTAVVEEEEPQEILSVKVVEPLDAVKVPRYTSPHAELAQKAPTEGGKRGFTQDLGFLGMLGQKDLNKAIGGVPTHMANASPGAGEGTDKGTGGEMLVGLGQGVKRTTVGNTGLAGLGGVGGGKGPGGGAGGYGDSLVGSGTGAGVGDGNGKALSSLALGDDMVLDGGLDPSVIKATIGKYLNQIRACYELGLRKNPGLTGQVTMSFEVAGTGRLNFAKVHQSTLGDEQVTECISQKMVTWQFPKPLGGVSVKVKYPFLLRPVNS